MPVTCVDLSSYQLGFDFQTFKNAGGLAVILKATEGTSVQDKCYIDFRAEAMSAGLKVATYHFFRPGDPKAQADYYYNFANPLEGERMVCDFEDENTTIDDMVKFFQELLAIDSTLELTVYSGHLIKDQLGTAKNDWLAQNTSLWVAQYTSAAMPTWPTQVWPQYSLWQYTDEGTVAGFSGNVDCNEFNGPDGSLLAWFGPAGEPEPVEEVATITISADVPVALRIVAGDNVTLVDDEDDA
jgi:lysozyme